MMVTCGTAYAAEAVHNNHKACGASGTCTHLGDTHNEEQTWTAWNGGKLSGNKGEVLYLYLADNVTVAEGIKIENQTVYLCLNGYTLTIDKKDAKGAEWLFEINQGGVLYLSDCGSNGSLANADGGGIMHIHEGTVNMYGGSISNQNLAQKNERVGCIFVHGDDKASSSNSAFNMYGGSITNNNVAITLEDKDKDKQNSSGAAGINVNLGRANLYGGTISGNTTTITNDSDTYVAGGGVSVGSKGSLTVYGGSVTDNKIGNDPDNVHLAADKTIALGNGFSNTETQKIGVTIDGVTADDLPKVFLNSGSALNPQKVNYFFSDDDFGVGIQESTKGIFTTVYTVTVKNGQAIGGVTDGKAQTDAQVTVTANEPEAGYVFAGWSSDDGVTFADRTAVTTTFTMPDKNVTVTANYKLNSYTITAAAKPSEGGTASVSGTTNEDGTYNHGTQVTLTATANAGYAFVNWTKGDVVASTNVEYSFAVTESGAYTANFAKGDYTIEYDLGGGALPEGRNNPIVYSVDTESFVLAEPVKTGYEFIGWTGSNGEAPQKEIGVQKGSTGNKRYVAHYKPVVYTIVYELDGGSAGGQNPPTYTIETPAFALKNPTREGYVFAGWTGTNGETPQMSVTIAQGSTKDRAYKANWKAVVPAAKPTLVPDVSKLPQTGDNSHMILWLAMGLFSAGGFVLMQRKKGSRN